jgi:hypothetical protein
VSALTESAKGTDADDEIRPRGGLPIPKREERVELGDGA